MAGRREYKKQIHKRDHVGGMTGGELRAARAALGYMWGLGRPLHRSEMGRILRLTGRDTGATVCLWERGEGPTGPASVAIEMMLDGARPRGLDGLPTNGA
jgi:hypothetical protein